MYLRRISDPLTQEAKLGVVGVDAVKTHARITHSDEDELIAGMIEAAYDHMAGEHGWLNGCCLLTEEWEVVQADGRLFDLPLRPVLLVEDVTLAARGADGLYADLDRALYTTALTSVGATVHASRGAGWPTGLGRASDAIRIRFKAGFGRADDIPSPIRLGIKMLAAHWFANREATTSDSRATPQQLVLGLKALCGRYRVSPDHS